MEYSNSQFGQTESKSIMVRKLISWGVATDETQANYILIAVIIVCFGATIWINFF